MSEKKKTINESNKSRSEEPNKRVHTNDEILGKKELQKVSRRSFLGGAAVEWK